MLEVIDVDFNDRDRDWCPDDVCDFEKWVTVTIGEDGAGSNYQFCLCTSTSISRLPNKRHVFTLDKWESIDILTKILNEFIIEKLQHNVKDDPYEHLSNYWYWEYSKYNS